MSSLLVASATQVQVEQTFTNQDLKLPIALATPPDGSKRLFLVQQAGKITILPADRSSSEETTFLDLTSRPLIKKDFEEGLLGLAFHPNFSENRKFYIYYTLQEPKHTVISEMQVSSSSPSKADPSTERVLLRIAQPYWNHNSGNLLFGPDGLLYIAVGDGGKSNDVRRFAQNPFAYNGKILRIDPDTRSGNRPYGLPEDNPFLDQEGWHPEIFALGLRNPWGICFHPETNELWCADVGQNQFEEINIIKSGGNYGWSFHEGFHPKTVRQDEPPEKMTFIDPIHEYGRTEGLSITGGFHYRGNKLPKLKGHYLYADWGFGSIWALNYQNGRKTENTRIYLRNEAQLSFRPTAIVEDGEGEVLILSHDHKIYTISPSS